MEKEANELEALNSLLISNNDRVQLYVKAAEVIKNIELKKLFQNRADESRLIAIELANEIVEHGGLPSVGSTSHAGKIYRVWMSVQAIFSENGQGAILRSCEFGENTFLAVYRTHLESNELTGDWNQLISRQNDTLKDSFGLLRQYLDEMIVTQ